MSENKQLDRVKEITDQLEAGIHDLFESERYQQWLTTMSRFHNYSLNNTMLIAMQKPEATLVAGYTAWQKQFGRQVQKGEKGIKILAPAPYKEMVEMDKIDPDTRLPVLDENGDPVKEEQEVTRPAYKVVSVFDVSQTDGKELPTIGVNELTGDVERYEQFFEALKLSCPVPMEFENIQGGAKGYYHQTDKRIAIQEGMSQLCRQSRLPFMRWRIKSCILWKTTLLRTARKLRRSLSHTRYVSISGSTHLITASDILQDGAKGRKHRN